MQARDEPRRDVVAAETSFQDEAIRRHTGEFARIRSEIAISMDRAHTLLRAEG